ncbi:MAG: GGDEF domain-containing protein [Ideonella sp.]|nr:GGDEF domain-containing protein [Ideonella sp.]
MIIRYTQSRERCAEVLRAALGHIGQHEACCNPVTFSVWYEYAAGMNAGLSQAIDACLRAKARLGDEAMLRLHREHVADPDLDAVQQINTEMQRVMSGVAANASRTGDSAGSFGAQIDKLAVALAQAASGDLPALLSGASAGAQAMKGSTAALVQQIREGQIEIERLRTDLVRARDEVLLDPLTGVLNRRGFDKRLAALVRQPARDGLSHNLVMIDIDHFKRVNDTHGHVIGDQVIRGLAELLRRSVPDGEHCVARYGGEEFALLLPDTAAVEGMRLADAVRKQVGAMKIRDRRTQQVLTQVTISAGVATLAPDDDPINWIARADAALYRSKQAGRNRVMC